MIRRGMSIGSVREEMAALSVKMIRADPADPADEADVARYLALKASRQHQLDELRFLRRLRHRPSPALAEAARTWPDWLRHSLSWRDRADIRACLRALKTAGDIGPRALGGEVVGEAPEQHAQAEAITIEIEALIGAAEGDRT